MLGSGTRGQESRGLAVEPGCGVHMPEKWWAPRHTPPGAESVGSAVRLTSEPHFLTQRSQASCFLPFLSCGMGITLMLALQAVVTMRSCTGSAGL